MPFPPSAAGPALHPSLDAEAAVDFAAQEETAVLHPSITP